MKKKIKDLSKTIKVEVTKDDIKKGKEGSHKCPIAQSLKRQGYKNPFVGENFILLDRIFMYDIPPKAQSFIAAFDSMEEVKPFKFTAKR